MSTVGELRLEGLALEVGCMNCQQHGFYDPASLSYPDDMPVDDIAAGLTCKQCGFANKPGTVMVWAQATKHRVTEFPLSFIEKQTIGN
jgi:hypothetical protein